jgi:glycosyltransferase involved in cell wall biosynthesis
MLVSVIIPTWNRPQLLLERSLPSVLAQTHAELDIHVIGDGTDAETVAGMAQITDPRVRFINRPGQVLPSDPEAAWRVGGSGPINYGLDTAKGDWVTILCDDDEWMPEYVETLLGKALSENLEAVYCRAEVVGHGFIGAWPPSLGGQALCLLWKRNDVRAALECDIPGDWDLYLRLMDLRWGFVEQVLYRYFPSRHVPASN